MLALLLRPTLHAADDVRGVIELSDGRTGHLNINWEIHPDGGRVGNIRINSGGYYGATMFLHEKEIAALRAAVVAAKPPEPNTPGKSNRIKIPDASGTLWVECVYPNKDMLMRFVRVESESGTYPPIVFDLAEADFDKLIKALDEVARQLDLAK